MFREELVSLLAGTTQKRSANSVANLRWFYPKRRVRLDSKYRFYASFLLVFIAKDEVNVAALALLSGFVIIIVVILRLCGSKEAFVPCTPFYLRGQIYIHSVLQRAASRYQSANMQNRFELERVAFLFSLHMSICP